MDTNYTSKLKEIKNLFSNWINRKLSVYGKVVIVKSLALSKLSHLAIVLPNLQPAQVKTLENMIFNFIWDGKPDKVAREHAKLKETMGGLGLIDIKTFWTSLKVSWFRRALQTKAFWTNILDFEIQDALSENIKILDVMNFGPKAITSVGKKLKNDF